MIRLSRKISMDMQITIEEETDKEALRRLAFYSEVPSCCPECQSALVFTYREVDGTDLKTNRPVTWKYWGMKCTKQGHQTTFGDHLDGSGFYYKSQIKWKTYSEIKDEGDK